MYSTFNNNAVLPQLAPRAQQNLSQQGMNFLSMQQQYQQLLQTMCGMNNLQNSGTGKNFLSSANPLLNSSSIPGLTMLNSFSDPSAQFPKIVPKSHAAGADLLSKPTSLSYVSSLNNRALALKRIKRKKSQTGRRRRSNEWKSEEVILLLQCTKLLINCELKTISQALFSCIKRSPGKCWGRAAEKKLKRMKIFDNWKTCSKSAVLKAIDMHLERLGALGKEVDPQVLRITKMLEAAENKEAAAATDIAKPTTEATTTSV